MQKERINFEIKIKIYDKDGPPIGKYEREKDGEQGMFSRS